MPADNRGKCKHCDQAIYRNARSADSPWRHVQTGFTQCIDGRGNPRRDSRAEPEGS